jgi:hypothetical protein
MIAIVSKINDDYSDEIIKWLIYFKVLFVKIDLKSINIMTVTVDLNNEDFIFKLKDGLNFRYSDISFFLCRSNSFKVKNLKIDSIIPHNLTNKFIVNEQRTLVEFLNLKIQQKCIGWSSINLPNKLIQLVYAKNIGIKIPKTIITNNKSVLESKFKRKSFVTKAIYENFGDVYKDKLYLQRVNLIDNFKDLPDFFMSSLFQEFVEKEFEIRIFYLDGNFYSICFDNSIEKPQVDMRDHYRDHSYFRFELPLSIEKKIIKLMKKLNLLFGSLDFIYGKDGNFYFLEVNPVGQFDWVSFFGDFELHKEIALFLKRKNIDYEKNKKRK